jgi:hypothetical protein
MIVSGGGDFVVRTVATTALAAIAATQEIAGGENDGWSFTIIVFTFHKRRR